MKRLFIVSFVLFVLILSPLSNMFCEDNESDAKDIEITAVMVLKLAGYDKKIGMETENVSIYVIGSPEVASVLKQLVGRKIGKATLQTVLEGDDVPTDAPTILFNDNADKVSDVVKFTRFNSVLSMTSDEKLVKKGITLGITVVNKKARIAMNFDASNKENREWNKAMMKIVKR